MKTISDSEVTAFQKCERVHMFSYGYNLRPTKASKPLRIGAIGHMMLEEFYLAKQKGFSLEKCISNAMCATIGIDDEQLPLVISRFLMFAKSHYEHDDFTIVAVEKPFECELIEGTVNFLFVPDLVVQLPNGRYRVYEFKWGYNFWTNQEVYHLAQLPKYIWGLRKLGYDVQDGIISQLRYRPIKNPSPSQLFRESIYGPKEVRLENIIEIQRQVAYKIMALPPKEIWKETALPSLNKVTCKDCFFEIPCDQMLDGINPIKTLQINYEQRERPHHND